MSNVLQVALFCASVAIVLVAACLIPMAVLALRQFAGMARAGEEIKANLDLLMRDSRVLVQNVNELSKRVQAQMDDVDEVMQTVQSWTARADRLVDGVGSIVEPPVFSLAALSNLVRTGAGAFIQSLFHANRA
jgi:uncharacterized protein YoxC